MSAHPIHRVSCNDFRYAPGGAWPWCDSCGVRADVHDNPPKLAEAVANIVARGRSVK